MVVGNTCWISQERWRRQVDILELRRRNKGGWARKIGFVRGWEAELRSRAEASSWWGRNLSLWFRKLSLNLHPIDPWNEGNRGTLPLAYNGQQLAALRCWIILQLQWLLYIHLQWALSPLIVKIPIGIDSRCFDQICFNYYISDTPVGAFSENIILIDRLPLW